MQMNKINFILLLMVTLLSNGCNSVSHSLQTKTEEKLEELVKKAQAWEERKIPEEDKQLTVWKERLQEILNEGNFSSATEGQFARFLYRGRPFTQLNVRNAAGCLRDDLMFTQGGDKKGIIKELKDIIQGCKKIEKENRRKKKK